MFVVMDGSVRIFRPDDGGADIELGREAAPKDRQCRRRATTRRQ
jgi:hypothetical protein